MSSNKRSLKRKGNDVNVFAQLLTVSQFGGLFLLKQYIKIAINTVSPTVTSTRKATIATYTRNCDVATIFITKEFIFNLILTLPRTTTHTLN